MSSFQISNVAITIRCIQCFVECTAYLCVSPHSMCSSVNNKYKPVCRYAHGERAMRLSADHWRRIWYIEFSFLDSCYWENVHDRRPWTNKNGSDRRRVKVSIKKFFLSLQNFYLFKSRLLLPSSVLLEMANKWKLLIFFAFKELFVFNAIEYFPSSRLVSQADK